MTLYDQIIDVAEEAANRNGVEFKTAENICDEVSEAVGIKLGYNSIGARLAEAAYNRIRLANEKLENLHYAA